MRQQSVLPGAQGARAAAGEDFYCSYLKAYFTQASNFIFIDWAAKENTEAQEQLIASSQQRRHTRM